jgi:hypothetical protein
MKKSFSINAYPPNISIGVPEADRIKMPRKTGVVLIDADVHQELKVCCAAAGISMKEILKKLIVDFLEEIERERQDNPTVPVRLYANRVFEYIKGLNKTI